MPSTLYATASLVASIRALLRRLQRGGLLGRRHAMAPRPHPLQVNPVQSDQPGRHPSKTSPQETTRHTKPPVRVLRVMEAGQTAAQGGRMVISGRMADVCAELDRMVAREAAMRPGACALPNS